MLHSVQNLIKTSLMLSMLILSINSQAGLLSSGFTAVYEVDHKNIYLGDATRTLTNLSDNRWQYMTVTETKGIASLLISDQIKELTTFTKQSSGIQPLVYEYKQYGGKREKHHTLTFDWKKLQLVNTYKNETLDIQPGTQDLLSFQLQLMLDLQSGKKALSYTIADKKRIDTYRVHYQGKSSVETPMKTFQAVELISDVIRGKAQFKIWCVPELEYFPVRILKIEDDGDETELKLREIRFPR